MSTYVLEGVDALGGLLDLTADDLGDELVGQLLQGAAAGLTGDDLGHLSSDGADLGRSSVGGLLDLVGAALGESDGEQAEEVVVGGLDRDVGLDQGLPLADERPQLVGCEVETVEVGQAVLALNLVDAELDLAEGVVLILLQVGEGDLDDAALQGVVGVLETGGPVDKSLADTVAGAVRSRSSPRGAVAIRVSGCLLSDVERRRSLFACACQSGCLVCCGGWGDFHRTLMPYQSLREKGSTVFFLRPFLPLDNLLFLSKVFPSADCSFSLLRRSVWAVVHRRWDRENRRTCQQPSLRGSDLKDGQWFVRWVELGDRGIRDSRRSRASNRQSEFSEEQAGGVGDRTDKD